MIIIAFQLKIIQQILFNLYLWQLKEYRLDRFLEHLNRIYPQKFSALLGLTLLSPLKLPQKSLKALILFFLNLGLNSIFFLSHNPWLIFLAIFLTPLIFLFSLWIIYPLEKIIRIIIYHLASKKIRRLQKKFSLTVIGITGSFGKTTSKFFITQILSLKFKTLATPQSVNTPLGVSLLILKKLNQDHQFFIVEMGAYKIGEIKELCQIVHPQIGIITGISNQHLALFGSQENIIKAKSELLQALPKEGVAIINKQSPYQPILKKAKVKKIYFYPSQQKLREEILAKTPIPSFLKTNLEPALILAKIYHLEEKKIKETLANLKLPPKTMKETKGHQGATIIDDSFNSNFEGTMAALDYLEKFNGKKIVVMPCLIELGKDAQEVHRKIGEKLTKVCDLAIITSSDYFSAIIDGAGERQKIVCLSQPQKVIKLLKKIVNHNSVVLIEGKVHLSIINFLVQ